MIITRSHVSRRTVLRQTVRPFAFTACNENTDFARSMPMVVICSMTSPPVIRLNIDTSILAPRCRHRVGEVPFIR